MVSLSRGGNSGPGPEEISTSMPPPPPLLPSLIHDTGYGMTPSNRTISYDIFAMEVSGSPAGLLLTQDPT